MGASIMASNSAARMVQRPSKFAGSAIMPIGAGIKFEEFMTNGPSALGTPIVFKGKWLGGTGKFEGLSGDIEIRPTPVLVSDTLVQGTGKKTGTYIIAKSPAAQR